MALDPKMVNREYKYGFRDDIEYVYRTPKGLSEDIVREISGLKNEPAWMLKMRLRGYKHFLERVMPDWGGDLDDIDFDDISYYLKPSEKEGRTWEEVPEKIRETFDRLGIPEAERKFLAGVGAQYDSEVVYHKTLKHLEEQGVVFMGTDAALKEYPEIFKEYFGALVPPEDNKFAALNTAVWSGGSFVYVPKGVKVEQPLQAYFRINSENMGQFERTLIIGDEDSYFHYIEGCTAPTYTTNSLHAAVVEVIARRTTCTTW
jgi:Fe-S cluster assembly protein SufB